MAIPRRSIDRKTIAAVRPCKTAGAAAATRKERTNATTHPGSRGNDDRQYPYAGACLGAAIGIGVIGMKASEAVGRNPGAATKILVQAILSTAFAEGIVFFAIFLARDSDDSMRGPEDPASCFPQPAQDNMELNALLAAVPAEAADGGIIHQTATQFGVTWPLFISQVISFAVVAFLLQRFAYKPILKVLEERRQRIAEGLANAERSNRNWPKPRRRAARSCRRPMSMPTSSSRRPAPLPPACRNTKRRRPSPRPNRSSPRRAKPPSPITKR